MQCISDTEEGHRRSLYWRRRSRQLRLDDSPASVAARLLWLILQTSGVAGEGWPHDVWT